MTTIIWNHGKLLADSRVTFYDGKSLDSEIIGVSDDCEKITLPEALFVNNLQVKAFAVCGDSALMSYLRYKDKVGGDLLDPQFYDGYSVTLCPTIIIVIAENFNFAISFENGVMNWAQYDPRIPLLAGTGTNYVEGIFTKVAPEVAMAHVLRDDIYSGGKVAVWKCNRSSIKYRTLNVARLTRSMRWARWINPLQLAYGYERHAMMMACIRAEKCPIDQVDDELMIVNGERWSSPF